MTLTIPKALGKTALKRNWSGTSRTVLTEYALRKEQTRQKFWALKSVMSHCSSSSSADIYDIFGDMFPDSVIAKEMKCGSTKLSNIITSGLASYFKKLLLALLCLLMNHSTMNLNRSKWTSL